MTEQLTLAQRLLSAVVPVLLLGACGLKGDLYIEEPPAEQPAEEPFDTGAGQDEAVQEAEYDWMDLLNIEITNPDSTAPAEIEPALEAAEEGRLEEYETQEALQNEAEKSETNQMNPELMDTEATPDDQIPDNTDTMGITPPAP